MMDEVDEIAALMTAYSRAVGAKEAGALSALYDDEVRVFDTWGRRPFDGLAAWRRNLEGWLNGLGDDERVVVAFHETHIVRRGDMGCLHARVTYSAVSPAGAVARWMHNRLSWVLTKSGTGWRIVHEHTSAPIGPDLKGILQGD